MKNTSETEIAVRDGNFFVIDDDNKKPNTIGKEKLLEYMHTQIVLGNKADELEIRKIYFKYAMKKKGVWTPIKSLGQYVRYDTCVAMHPKDHPTWCIWEERWSPGDYEPYDVGNYNVIEGCKGWLTRSLGSLVKEGFLIVIPKGYILQRIEESKDK